MKSADKEKMGAYLKKLIAVSDTHLDVYKRQVQENSIYLKCSGIFLLRIMATKVDII